ncbi:hypothetical protein BV22DRAFT_1019397 [Leucogyrophana mollusca]|uniref:Uncharacterized protein n=1 Tax=Leucogyrophana mollusca TaxID=85980 RepID=A0ACB8B6T9_9AGAM|nr:hypothetical protein BV22DRAFT_1019397 [Leucogyrophana mollusca]
MVWMTGGYLLELPEAKAWAQRKYPDMEFGVDVLIPNFINRYFRAHRMFPACIAVDWHGQNKAYFMTHGKVDPYATKKKHRHFREDARAQGVRKMLFVDFEDEFEFLKNIQFVTVADPYNNGLPA